MTSINDLLQERFGERVYKVGLSSGCSCPNRDGTIGEQGCIFCHADALRPSTEPQASAAVRPIPEQLEEGLHYIRERHRARKAIAHFNNATNTHAPAAALAPLFRAAIAHPQVVGLAISTRPDCLDDEHLALFEELSARTMLWVELGLESSHDASLAWMQRGHTAAQFAEACSRLHERGIPVCAHLILGIPAEDAAMREATARFLNRCGVWGMKLHNLHVLEGTELARQWRAGSVPLPTLERYATMAVDLLEQLSPAIVVHRVTGHSPRRLTLAPAWSVNKLAVMNAVGAEFARRDTWQGKHFRCS